MIMTTAALSEEQKADLPRALKGSICRCTGYGSIADAVSGTARIIPNDGGSSPIGQGLGAPAGPDIVTGAARFTCDLAPDRAEARGPDIAPEPRPTIAGISGARRDSATSMRRGARRESTCRPSRRCT